MEHGRVVGRREVAAPSKAQRRWTGVGLRRERWLGYAFIAPMFVFLMAIVIYPLADAFRISLFREVGVNVRYEGLGNYRRVLQSNVFWHGLQVSLIYTVASVALHLFVGLPAALFLSRVRRGRKVLRLLLLVPWMVAEVYGATMWVWMLDPNFGVLNYMLRGAGVIREYQAWLGQPGLALTSVILVDAWRGFPFVTLLLLAGLMTIPLEEYEAAAIDGAGRLQQLRYVTLPHLVEILGVSTTLDVINTIRRFGIIAVMTKGGPVDATETLPMLIYNSTFVANDFGRAAASGVLLLFVLLLLSALYIFQLQPTGNEGSGR